MKVLWFSNSPGNAIERLEGSLVGSSWVSALDKRIQGKVELYLAFYYPKRSDPFRFGETTYHPIGRKNWKLNVLKDIFRTRIIDKQDLNRYLEIINRVNPDIIHIHGTENPFGCIIPYTKIPVVVSVQGYVTVIEHKFQNDYTKEELGPGIHNFGNGLKNFLFQKSFSRIKKNLGKRKEIEQINLRFTKNVLGRTAWDKRVTSILAPHSRYFHCDEIMRDVFYRTKWRYDLKTVFIIHSTLGNKPYKGFETLCEALYELRGLPGIQVQWQVAGIQENDSIVKITRHKLKDRFPKSAIHYLGNVGPQQLAEVMLHADIFASTSHIENSPNSLCEAMLLGMPCIATFAGGTSSLLTDGIEGILIQDGDPWALAGAIIELCRNPDLAIKYGRNARERALIRHEPDRIVNGLIKCYREILSESTIEHNIN